MPRAAESPEADRALPRRRVRVGALLLLAAVAVGVYGLDQVTKLLVDANMSIGDSIPLLGDLLQLHYVTNTGAAFSLASGFTWILTVIAVGVIVFIVIFAPRIRSLGWATMFGLVLGGALGNATDRLLRGATPGSGHVIDFIQVWGFPAIFNVADIGVVAAMGLFVLLSLRGVGLDGTRTPIVKPTGRPVRPSAERSTPPDERD